MTDSGTFPQCANRLLGWQGISIYLPREWELCAYVGNARRGEVTLDDGIHVRFRASWASSQVRLESLFHTKRRFLKRNESVHWKCFPVEERFGPVFLTDKHAVAFQVKADPAVAGIAWECLCCKKVVLFEMRFPGLQEPPEDAWRWMASASIHSSTQEADWSIYGFRFRCSVEYELAKTDFRPGRLLFSFRSTKGRILHIERWGLAGRLLKDMPIEEWPAELLKLDGNRPLHLQMNTMTKDSSRTLLYFQSQARRIGLRRLMQNEVLYEGRIMVDHVSDKVLTAWGSGLEERELDAVSSSMETS